MAKDYEALIGARIDYLTRLQKRAKSEGAKFEFGLRIEELGVILNSSLGDRANAKTN